MNVWSQANAVLHVQPTVRTAHGGIGLLTTSYVPGTVWRYLLTPGKNFVKKTKQNKTKQNKTKQNKKQQQKQNQTKQKRENSMKKEIKSQ